MLAWMGYAMLAAAALGVAAWLVDFSVAGRFGRRRVVWAGVFLASAIGPVVFSVTRDIPTVVAEENGGSAPSASGRKAPIVSDRVLGSAWLAVSAVFALWLVATQRRLRRRLRGCPSRIVDGERVLVSSDFGPAVAGVVRPQIVLPEWALAMRESDRRIIVAHETEHRQAHDPLLAAMALMAATALVVVRGPSIRVLLPPMERTGERRDGRSSSASTVERRWVTPSAASNRRILRSRAAPNRGMLLPIHDSLRPSPP